jgi:hypothetical protein
MGLALGKWDFIYVPKVLSETDQPVQSAQANHEQHFTFMEIFLCKESLF